MSEEQLTALLAKIKDDASLREKIQAAPNFDAAVALTKKAGFDVSKAELIRSHATQTLELSDEELESVAGGTYIAASVAATTIVVIGATEHSCPPI